MWVDIRRSEAGVYQVEVWGVRGEGGIETWEKYIDQNILIKRMARKSWSVCSWDGSIQQEYRTLKECKDFVEQWKSNREWELYKQDEAARSNVIDSQEPLSLAALSATVV
jgi:transposase